MEKILITGGAGFVGSSLALLFNQAYPEIQVIVLDNLRRRGSEMSLPRLKAAGIEFIHGDIRCMSDIEDVGAFDLLVDCSAEPSVQAGYKGQARYVIDTNLGGTINCLEAARQFDAKVIFLSTSRVYPIKSLRALPLEKEGRRLVIPSGVSGVGWSAKGITEEFSLRGYRSLYGTTKLSSEMLFEEYQAAFGLKVICNRCGVLTGPWQMGKTDQGIVSLWAAKHFFGGKLSYLGFGGEGLQVRDILHVKDLFELLQIQLARIDEFSGKVFNVGGGHEMSVSLAELTLMCAQRSGRKILISSDPATNAADIPYYVTDNSLISSLTDWKPRILPEMILDEVFDWLRSHEGILKAFLA